MQAPARVNRTWWQQGTGWFFRFPFPANEMAAEPLSHPRRVSLPIEEVRMPQGDKSAYTAKQKRQAAHIAEGYEEQGVSDKQAEARAWATVNKSDGGGKKSGSGRAKAH